MDRLKFFLVAVFQKNMVFFPIACCFLTIGTINGKGEKTEIKKESSPYGLLSFLFTVRPTGHILCVLQHSYKPDG